jgi:hypothetical protein
MNWLATIPQPISDDMQTALNKRQTLIEARALWLRYDARDAEARWTRALRR